jgi:bacterial/archaeal transporter family protein
MSGYGFAALAIFFWGAAAICDRLGISGTSPGVGLTIRTAAVTVGVFIVFLFTGQMREIGQVKPASILFLALSGLFAGVVGQLFYFKALKPGQVSTVVPLTATYPLVALILAVIFLKENVTWVRTLGALLVASGVFLLKWQR